MTLSNQPRDGDVKLLKDIAQFRVSQIGLKYVPLDFEMTVRFADFIVMVILCS